jgi:hypothetical protein
VPLLHLLHLPVLVAQLRLAILQILLCDLPEGIDLVLLGQMEGHEGGEQANTTAGKSMCCVCAKKVWVINVWIGLGEPAAAEEHC